MVGTYFGINGKGMSIPMCLGKNFFYVKDHQNMRFS